MTDKKPTARDYLINFAIIHKGDWNAIHSAIKSSEKHSDEEILENISSLKCKAVTVLDPEYPQQLRKISNPPFVLFYKGDINLIQDGSACVSIVGAKNADAGSLKQAEEIAKALSDSGKAIVSGSSKGVCVNALKSAKKPVCVMGSGFDHPYPMENAELFKEIAKDGLLVSEYPPSVMAEARNFPTRNRIIAGISDKMVCCKVQKHSGSLISIAFALNFGKDIASVIPLLNDADTVNGELIENGAFPIASTATAVAFAG